MIRERPTRPARPAFTIVELLVTIGILGVLAAIVLPALSHARELASRTGSAANLRSIAQLVELYAQDNAESYPWGVAGINSCGIPTGFAPIWEMSSQWPLVMANTSDPTTLREISLSPGAERDTGPCIEPPSYTYSHSFLADPIVWSGAAAPDDRLLRAPRTHEILNPSSKALMWEWELPYITRQLRTIGPDLDERTPVAFPDSHVATKNPSSATPAIANPFENAASRDARLHNTADGVRGRDF